MRVTEWQGTINDPGRFLRLFFDDSDAGGSGCIYVSGNRCVKAGETGCI